MGDQKTHRPSRWSNRLISKLAATCLASIAVGTLIGSACAVDWSVTSTVSQRMEVDDNRTVSDPSNGYVVGSHTSLGTSIAAKAPAQSFNLFYGLIFDTYAGPGSDTLDDQFNFDDVSASYSKRMPLTSYGLSANFVRAPVSTTEFDDSGITNIDAYRLTYTAGANVSRQINRQNSVSLNVSATRVDFTENSNGLTPYFNANTGLSWSHTFNRRTSASINGNVGYSEFENDENTRNLVFSSTVGLSHRLTKRLSVSANVGARVNNSQKDATFLMPASRETNAGFTGGFNLSYKPTEATGFSLGWAHGLQPSSEGELKNRSSLSFNMNHAINSKSSIGLNIATTLQEPASGSGGEWSKTLSVGPTYSHQLAQYWNANLGYLYRYRESDGDKAHSNKVYFTVSRKLIVVP